MGTMKKRHVSLTLSEAEINSVNKLKRRMSKRKDTFLVNVDAKQKKSLKVKIKETFAFLLFELLDLVIDLGGYFWFMSFSNLKSTHPNFAILYSFAIILNFGSTVYMIRSKLMTLKSYTTALQDGILSKSALLKNRGRVTPSDQVEQSQKLVADADNLELFIIESNLRLAHYKANIISAYMEDALGIVLALYRRFAMNNWTSYYACMGTGVGFLQCNIQEPAVTQLELSIIFSLIGFVYKISYMRDRTKEQEMIDRKKNELMTLLEKEESVLDHFTDVPPFQVQKVVTVRHLLKKKIEKYPPWIVSDVNILRFVKDSKFDEFAAFQKFNKMLEWRDRHDMNKVAEQMLRTDYDSSGWVEAWQGKYADHLGFDDMGNFVACQHVGEMDWKRLSHEMPVSEFARLQAEAMEYGCIVLDHLSRQRKRVVNMTSLSNVKGFNSDFFKCATYIGKTSSILENYYPEHVTKLIVLNVNDVILRLHKTLLVPFINNDFNAKFVFIPRTGNAALLAEHGVSLDVVPVAAGGLKTTGEWKDPFCCKDTDYRPLSYYLGPFTELQLFKDVTPQEVEAVKEMKPRLNELGIAEQEPVDVLGDIALLRYLRKSHELNIDEALNNLKTVLQWRKDNGADEIRRDMMHRKLTFDAIPRFAEYCDIYPSNQWLGEDINGDIITIDGVYANVQWQKLRRDFPIPQFRKLNTYVNEIRSILINQQSTTKQRVVMFSSVTLLKGCSASTLAQIVQSTKHVAALSSIAEHYPSIKTIKLLGMNRIISATYNTIKPLLPSQTQEQLEIYSGSRADTAKLLTQIPSDMLPVSMGGNNTLSLKNGSVDYDCVKVENYEQKINTIMKRTSSEQ